MARAKRHYIPWTYSIAVESRTFIEEVKSLLGSRAMGREILKGTESYHLREEAAPYMPHFSPEKNDIDPQNTFSWNINFE